MSTRDLCIKRMFDFAIAFLGLILFGWVIILAWLATTLYMKENGLFIQHRIGRKGRIFSIYKIKTMKKSPTITTTSTQLNDPRITPLGKFFRKYKIDELPQLVNVLLGHMSLVGPRPDVPGFADQLSGEDRKLLNLRPGITGPATLKYRDEEEILSKCGDPETYNREVIYPDKVRLNLKYIEEYSFWRDLIYLKKTFLKG